MELSRFTRTMTHKDTVAVFHALHPEPIFIQLGLWEKFFGKYEDHDLRHVLTEKGLLISASVDDEHIHREVSTETAEQRSMAILYLVLTKKCNFCCRPCFQHERHPDLFPVQAPMPSMNKETAFAGIDAFVRHREIADADAVSYTHLTLPTN